MVPGSLVEMGFRRTRKYSRKCGLCGKIWQPMSPPPCTHTRDEWDAYVAAWPDKERQPMQWLEDPMDPIPDTAPSKQPRPTPRPT
jgi:hypothetical protein